MFPVIRAVARSDRDFLGGEGNVAAMRFWNENATPPIILAQYGAVAVKP